MNAYKVIHLSSSDPRLDQYRYFICASWKMNLRYSNDWFELIDSDRYYEVYGRIIERIFNNPNSIIHLALLADDEDICVGWSVTEGDTLHYIFVKPECRKQGVGGSLLPKSFDRISHVTDTGKSIWKRKFKHVIFDPFT